MTDVPQVKCPEYGVVQVSQRWIGLDETSFQKRHEYVTGVTDLDGRRVLSVLDARTNESVDAHSATISASARASAEVAAMDLWHP